MRERFTRYRATLADTFTPPLKGMSLREQRTLGKLARSGERIAAFRFSALVLPLLLAMEAVFAIVRHPLLPMWQVAALVGASAVAAILIIRARRQYQRTAKANGWDESGGG